MSSLRSLDLDVEAARAIGERGRPPHRGCEALATTMNALVGVAVHDDVVDDAAAGVEQQRVLRLAVGDLATGCRRARSRGRRGSLRPAYLDLGHVRDVEDAGRGAHGVVLGEVGGVAHRHLPAGEVGEARTGVHVDVVERAETLCTAVGAAGLIIHGVLLLLRLLDGTPPLSWCLRVSPASPSGSAGFHLGRDVGERIHFPERPCDAVRVPERLAGRLAPSVLPRCRARPRAALPHRGCGLS